jgi:hypothetical protein
MRIAKAVRVSGTTGLPLCRSGPLKGLSCVMGNYHAQFLGGLGLATAPGYPVFL